MARVGMQWVSRRRGSIEVFLTSPSGQVAALLRSRPLDRFAGRSEMLWKSLLHTGEVSYGKWTVTVSYNLAITIKLRRQFLFSSNSKCIVIYCQHTYLEKMTFIALKRFIIKNSKEKYFKKAYSLPFPVIKIVSSEVIIIYHEAVALPKANKCIEF